MLCVLRCYGATVRRRLCGVGMGKEGVRVGSGAGAWLGWVH